MNRKSSLLFILERGHVLSNKIIIMELEKIGENAGKVWHVLNEGRELTIPELSRRIDLSHEDTTLAIGWLARENKIYIQRKNGQILVSNGIQQGLYFG